MAFAPFLPPLMVLLFFFFFKLSCVSSMPTFFPRLATYESALKQAKAPEVKIPYETHYFPQVLDHFTFRPNSSRTFQQKYLINGSHWSPGGPIFVYCGNEGNIEWFASNTGFLLDIAPRFRALLVFIEHRFYGDSMPFGKDSYNSPEQLGYLNSQQALADFAVLIRSLKHNLSSEASPVVVFGGSYGGMLAAWFRLKYPHIAIGALAASAPILHFDDITPWSSFYNAVSKDFKDSSFNCYEVIKGSWVELEALSSKEGLGKLSKIFRTCKPLHSIDSAWSWLWEAFVNSAMMNYPTESNFMMPLPAYPVKQMCKIIDGFPLGATKLSKAFAAASLYHNYSGTEKCFDLAHKSDPHGLGGWDWQACTEMVMPMTCSVKSMFPPSGYDYKLFSDRCFKTLGVRPRPLWITTEFGGKRIGQVLKRFGSNIIFSNGMQDPWSRGGVLKSISATLVAIVTEKGAHHADLRSATKDDPKWLKEQRRQEVRIIRRWIKEYHKADTKHEQ